MKMKKFFPVLLTLLMILSIVLAGCGLKKKAEEAVAEKILSQAGVNVDLDLKGDKIVVKGEDGEQLIIGEGEWPSSDLAKSIPKLSAGKVTSVIEASDSLNIMIEEITDKEFTDYLEEIKETFTENSFEASSDTGMMYSASNEEGIVVLLTYEKDEWLNIAVSQKQTDE